LLQLTRYYCDGAEGGEDWALGTPEEDDNGGVVLMTGDV
jgi:hypothetical protein